MSAFICSDSHFAAIARSVYFDNALMAQNLADALKKINIQSVNFRYQEKTRVTKCKICTFNGELTNDDVAKLIDCWVYQSCENPTSIEFETMRVFLVDHVLSINGKAENGRFWTI